MEAMRRMFWRVPSGSRSAHSLESSGRSSRFCQAFALPDEVAHECVAHIVGQCDEDDDASGGVSGCGDADDRAVAVEVMAAREPEIGPRLEIEFVPVEMELVERRAEVSAHARLVEGDLVSFGD